MTWRAIPGFAAYEAHNMGYVRRCGSAWALTPRPRNGYLRVALVDDSGRRRWRPVHTLVLETFAGPRPSPRHEGAHRDGDKGNNALTNLRWKTPRQNARDKRAHGTASKPGVKRTELTPEQVEAIRQRAEREAYSAIARDFGLHRHSVSRIARGLRRAEGASA
jgi:hypothetical protein